MVSNKKTEHDKEALLFHCEGKAGKVEMQATKALNTQRDLALAGGNAS